MVTNPATPAGTRRAWWRRVDGVVSAPFGVEIRTGSDGADEIERITPPIYSPDAFSEEALHGDGLAWVALDVETSLDLQQMTVIGRVFERVEPDGPRGWRVLEKPARLALAPTPRGVLAARREDEEARTRHAACLKTRELEMQIERTRACLETLEAELARRYVVLDDQAMREGRDTQRPASRRGVPLSRIERDFPNAAQLYEANAVERHILPASGIREHAARTEA